MDNLCHTLVGAALAEAGLKRRTPLATATLMIGANLPDVDVLAYFWGADTAIAFRRGWTHGVLALALWPFVLTGLMLAWDRWVRRRPDDPARVGALFWLSVISILSHPFLDWLNTYGMRWLMPFRDVWSYADTLFIIDVWIWLILIVGVVWSRLRARRGRPDRERPARMALAAVGVYILLMAGSHLAAREVVREGFGGSGPLMAGPLPVTPLRRQAVADLGEQYVLGTVDWLRRPPLATQPPRLLPKGRSHPAVTAAAATREGRIFLHWARFPYFRVEERPDAWIVRMGDARYTINPATGFGSLTVAVPKEKTR
jgi:inner membrane protein